jgi:hypothetical protein
MLWIDVPVELALGYSPSAIAKATPKRLILQDPRIVKKYNDILRAHLEKHDVLNQLRQLEMNIDGKMSHAQMNEYNQLDNIRIQATLVAQQRCRKLRMGAVPYSPKLCSAGKKICAWKLLLKKKSGGSVKTKYFHRTLKDTDITEMSLLTISDIQENLCNAWQSYHSLKRSSTGDQATWIEELAMARASEGKTSVAAEIKKLLVRETQRRDARIIKTATLDQQRTGLSMIKIRHAQDWAEITEKEEMEKALLKELRQRFNQVIQTPFCVSPLFKAVGPLGISAEAQQILDGTYHIPENCDPWAAKLIPHLTYAFPDTDFPMDHSPQHHKAGWQKVRERTSAGISGLTIPQMKAHLQDNYNIFVDTIFARLPYKYGFSPTRWRKGIDVMLEKKKGVYNIDKLRAILLYEADFNQNNKKLGRDMMALADAIAPEQFGSRKFLSAVDQSLNKALTFHIWRQHRTCAALCSNDAKGCYDRIVHNVASLCMQRVRVPKEPIVSMFGTIQSLQHHVRTAFGDSKRYSSAYNDSTPIQGVGQGNGAGPQIWALISTPIFNMVRSMGLGTNLRSPISDHELSFAGFGFVDDTDLAISNEKCNYAKEAARELQKAVAAWEGGLRATGGALEPTKSLWYPIEFKWKAGEPFYRSVNECQVDPIMVRDPAGNILPLQCLEPSQAERTPLEFGWPRTEI